MRELALGCEAHRGVGECSKEGPRDWGAIVSEYTSEEWPPAEYWSVLTEEEREGSLLPTSEKALMAK